MNTIEKTLENVKVLKGWGNMNVLPKVEEKKEDIWMLIKYQDHGDDYLIVGTRDGKIYKYGLFVTCNYSEYYSYARKPELFKQLDERSKLSNEIFWKLKTELAKSNVSFGYDRKCLSKDTAQFTFEGIIRYMKRLVEVSVVIFDYEDKKGDILNWLELNDIATDKNINILNNTKFNNKDGEYGTIGISGKMDISGCTDLIVDDVEFICINNKTVDPNKVLIDCDCCDKWGFVSKVLSLKGFRQSKARA